MRSESVAAGGGFFGLPRGLSKLVSREEVGGVGGETAFVIGDYRSVVPCAVVVGCRSMELLRESTAMNNEISKKKTGIRVPPQVKSAQTT